MKERNCLSFGYVSLSDGYLLCFFFFNLKFGIQNMSYMFRHSYFISLYFILSEIIGKWHL